MDQDKLERYNAIEIERQQKGLEVTRAKVEKGLADLAPEVLSVFFKLLASTDENIQAKMVTLYMDRVVPKVAVRTTTEDPEAVESEAKKASRAEIEELIQKRKSA